MSYQFRKITDKSTASQEDIDFNIRLARAKRKFGDFFNAETIGANNQPIAGEYHEYTEEFIEERKKYEYFVPVGRHGFWRRKPEVSDDVVPSL